MSERLAQRSQLGDLKNAGVLTDAEFEAQKARILTPAWKDLAALLDDDADRLRAIEQGLAGRPDPQTLGLLLVDKALILANNGNRDEAISILGTLAVSPDSTLAAEHHAKATLAILIFN